MITEQKLKEWKFPSGNYIELLTTKEAIKDNWDFLLEGLESLNDPRRANMNVTTETFYKTVLKLTTLWPDGAALILRSKNGKPLGFCGAYNNTSHLDTEKILWIFICYSNGKCKTTVLEYMDYLFKFAKHFGYDKAQAASGRINGAAFYWYEKKLDFHRRYIVFEKSL